ncbi:MAG: hypothetical protein RSB57_06235 [Hungatella sp.]
MLNEDKIKLMTGISMFEKKEGKKIFPINRYFKEDYIGNHLVRGFLGYTFCWLLGVIIVLLYKLEVLFGTEMFDQIFVVGIQFLSCYVIGLILYLILTFYVFQKKYSYASRGMKIYVAKLRRLEKRYEFQNKTKELAKGGRHHDRTSGI